MEAKENVQPEHHILEDDPNSEHKTPVSGQLVVLSLFFLAIFSSGVITKVISYLDKSDPSQTATINANDAKQEITQSEKDSIQSFEERGIQAEAGIIYDVNKDEVMFAKNATRALPLASLTKLMTALVAYEIVAGEERVNISNEAVDQDGDSGLRDGEEFTLEELSDLTLVGSSNDGAFAMAAAAGALLNNETPTETFVQAMNIRAKELGLKNTYFRNPTGLDISETEAGAYGSALDVAKLMDYIVKNYPGILERTTETQLSLENKAGTTHSITNTNQALDNIPGLIASKTGYTELAGGNLAIAFDVSLNRPIIVVALGSSINGRFSDVLKMSDFAKKITNE